MRRSSADSRSVPEVFVADERARLELSGEDGLGAEEVVPEGSRRAAEVRGVLGLSLSLLARRLGSVEIALVARPAAFDDQLSPASDPAPNHGADERDRRCPECARIRHRCDASASAPTR